MNFNNLGIDDFFKEQYSKYEKEGYIVTRVAQKNKNSYLLFHEDGFINGKFSGKLRYEASTKKDLPAVGDWVYTKIAEDKTQAIIYGLLNRKTCFTRKPAISGGRKIKNGIIVGGSTQQQVVAANIDLAFIVTGLDDNFNLQRIERYLTLCYNSGAKPVVILNKADCCDNVDKYINMVQKIAMGVQIHAISVLKDIGMEVFTEYLKPGKSVVFLGSSGVGKSTITNYLLGEEKQKTNTTCGSTGKGRHTTTCSEMIIHSSGSLIIDTPGIRELQLWSSDDALEENFDDVVSLIDCCKYRDCRHESEPGCAIRQAIEDGHLEEQRFDSYLSQYYELQRLNSRIKETEVYLSKRGKLQAKVRQWGHK